MRICCNWRKSEANACILCLTKLSNICHSSSLHISYWRNFVVWNGVLISHGWLETKWMFYFFFLFSIQMKWNNNNKMQCDYYWMLQEIYYFVFAMWYNTTPKNTDRTTHIQCITNRICLPWGYEMFNSIYSTHRETLHCLWLFII